MEFLLFIPLVRLIRSDFRKRRVKITDLLLFGCLQLFVSWWGVGWKELVFRLKGNGWVFLFMVTGVVLYVFIRYGQGRRVMRRLGGNRGRLVLSDVGSCFYPKDICIFSDTGFSADVLWLGNI